VLDMERRRWGRWSTVIDHGVVFPQQYAEATWDSIDVPWDAAEGSWETAGGGSIERGMPTYFLRAGALGKEDATIQTQFGLGSIPTFVLGKGVSAMPTDQFTTNRVQLVYEGVGTIAVDLPDRDGEFVQAGTAVLATGHTREVPMIHTGRGVGCRLRITSGSPRIRQVTVAAVPAGIRL
jgi:hypothetical protein